MLGSVGKTYRRNNRVHHRPELCRRVCNDCSACWRWRSLTFHQRPNISAAAFQFSTCSAIVIAPRALTANSAAFTLSASPAARWNICRAPSTLFASWEQNLIRREPKRRSPISIAPRRKETKNKSALPQLLTLRLAEAVTSRELLLRELAAIMRQETSAKAVVITEPGEHNRRRVVIAHGCTPAESAQIAEQLDQLVDDEAQADYAQQERRGDSPTSFVSRSAGHALHLAAQPRESSGRTFAGSVNARRGTGHGRLCVCGPVRKRVRACNSRLNSPAPA